MEKDKLVINKVVRFLEIDINFLRLPISFTKKIEIILATNLSICRNLIFKRTQTFKPTSINGVKFQYDTVYSTKTLLTACYDFYTETEKGTILKENPVIIDVGSNIGQFLFAAKTFFPKSKVYCFEPDPNVYELLKRNALNFSNVKIYNIALSKKRGKRSFYISDKFSEWSSLYRIDKEMKEIKVDSKRGDSVLSNIKKIDLLKIDVEGAELEVLKGMGQIIKRANFLLVECSINRLDNQKILSNIVEELSHKGFSVYRIGRIFSGGWAKKQGAVDIIFINNLLKNAK